MSGTAAEDTHISNVHPPDWANPSPRAKYHLVVIGGGTGGLVTAAIASGLGAKVALVERHYLGGDCLNVGCVPSKALIRAARAWREAREAHTHFGGPSVNGGESFAVVMARMQTVRAGLSAIDSAARYRSLGVDVFFGEARFVAGDTVDVDGRKLRFHRAVIASGSRPLVPPIPGLSGSNYLTNESIFSISELPRRLAVIGGGPIGAELAQAFARFGSSVTILELGKRILANDDPDAAKVVARSLERDGVRLLTDVKVEQVKTTNGTTRVAYTRAGEPGTVEAEALLVSSGRAPNVDGLGLEAAGVEYDRGKVFTDERLRTSNHRIFAVGDVTGRLQFTHTADAHARMVVPNALFFGRKKVSDLIVPWCTYTQPELAHVGASWSEVAKLGDDADTITIPLSEVDRARLDGSDEGFLRVHLKKGSDRILAATIVADNGGDIISQLSQGITHQMGLGAIGKTIFPYPTQAEAVRKAADQYQRRKLTSRARKVLDLYFRIVR